MKGKAKQNSKKAVSKKAVSNKNEIFNKKTKLKNYYGFEDRVFLLTLLILFLIAISMIFFNQALEDTSGQLITYKENSKLDYKVNLKKNDFYEEDFLGKDMIYVASLIDKIDVDFDYLFKIAEKSDINFDYDVVGKLSITDTDGKNTFFEKNYVLSKNQKNYIRDKNKFKLDKKISIDYGTYNNLANKFRTSYGIDTKSNLVVYLNIHKKGINEEMSRLNDVSQMSITIPLSEKAVNIKMDYKEINKSSQFYAKPTKTINDYIYIGLGSLFALIALIYLINMIRFILKGRYKLSSYDKYIKKLLNEYDRLIVETKTEPITKDKNLVEISSFEELLDVRDNLNLPIKYYIVNDHHKANFYINHNDELYLYIVKSTDIEKKKK